MKFSWPVRIFAYVVAAVALIRLLGQTGAVNFQPAFIAFLDQLKGIIELELLFDLFQPLIIEPVLALIRSLGWNLPALQDHWQQLFVLTWLLNSTLARHFSLSTDRIENMPTVVNLVLAGTTTLPFCVAAGLMPLGWGAMLMALASPITFYTVASFIVDEPAFISGGFAALLVALGIIVPGKTEITAILVLAGLVALTAAVLLFGGLRSGSTLRSSLSEPATRVGLDIFAAMGLAFAAVIFLSKSY